MPGIRSTLNGGLLRGSVVRGFGNMAVTPIRWRRERVAGVPGTGSGADILVGQPGAASGPAGAASAVRHGGELS